MANQLYHPPAYSYNQWRKEQIYTTPSNANGIVSGGVVPNVGDSVISWSGAIKFEERVTHVDPATNVSTLEPVEFPNNGNNTFVGIPVGVANLSNVANLYVNPTDARYSASIDLRLPIYGIDLSFARVFLGVDITNVGKVISLNLDSDGGVVDDKVEMVRSEEVGATSYRYVPRPFNLTHLVEENTVVTVVFYSDSGNEVMFQECCIKYNHIVANVQNQALFINALYLDTPYLNPLNNKELLIPKNLLSSSFTPRIFKEFQNGNKEELYVGSSNVTLAGWGDHVIGEQGEQFPIVLNYVLANGEMSSSVDPYTGKHMTTHYTAYVVAPDITLEQRLYILPYYDENALEYVLRFFVYGGNRDLSTEVTEHVRLSNFKGANYGYKQNISYSLDMSLVDGLPALELSGSAAIQLTGVPLANTTTYRLWYYPDDERYYGDELRLKVLTHFGTKTLTVQNGYTQKDEWLENMFYKLEPFYNKEVEDEAPSPDFMDIIFDDRSILTIDVDNYWNGEVDITGAVPEHGSMAIIKFYSLADNGSRIELAATSLAIEVV